MRLLPLALVAACSSGGQSPARPESDLDSHNTWHGPHGSGSGSASAAPAAGSGAGSAAAPIASTAPNPADDCTPAGAGGAAGAAGGATAGSAGAGGASAGSAGTTNRVGSGGSAAGGTAVGGSSGATVAAGGSAGSAAGGAKLGALQPVGGCKVAGPATPDGVDFIDDAKLLYRVAACGDLDQPLPEVFGDKRDKLAKVIKSHCKPIMERMSGFRTTYFDKGRAFFDAIEPKDLPTTVVYPFGGGDLLSALVAFPNATEITTISLEMAGDPRRLRTASLGKIESSLSGIRLEIGGLVSVGSNTSTNLSQGQQNELPTQVASFLLGLVAGGYEPVAMYYFRLAPDGSIDYLDQKEIDDLDAAAKAKRPKSLKSDWFDPNFSQAFANVELRYRKIGDTTVRVHRHIGWNLGDAYLKDHPELIKHLEAKGQVTLLTKGASYLLWNSSFSTIRNYMLGHLAWMLSDSTGIPPAYAKKAGMVQETYGYFHGAFLDAARDTPHEAAFIELWAKQPRRKLGFRFGYVDKDKQAHLVVTRPK